MAILSIHPLVEEQHRHQSCPSWMIVFSVLMDFSPPYLFKEYFVNTNFLSIYLFVVLIFFSYITCSISDPPPPPPPLSHTHLLGHLLYTLFTADIHRSNGPFHRHLIRISSIGIVFFFFVSFSLLIRRIYRHSSSH